MKKFVRKGKSIGEIAFKTKNIVIEKVQDGINNDKCYIIGTGYSLSVDNNDKVLLHDPFMDKFGILIDKNITVFSFYYTFESSGLEESSRELATFINNLDDKYKNIYLIGQSKCGVCSYNATHYCDKDIILVTIAAPFKGTPTADIKCVDEALKRNVLRLFYDRLFCNHNVDKDIIPGSQFLINLKDAKYKEHINIISRIEKISDCRCLSDLFLYFWNKALNLNGDGVIPCESQKINSTETINIVSSHAHSLENGIRALEKFFDK